MLSGLRDTSMAIPEPFAARGVPAIVAETKAPNLKISKVPFQSIDKTLTTWYNTSRKSRLCTRFERVQVSRGQQEAKKQRKKRLAVASH